MRNKFYLWNVRRRTIQSRHIRRLKLLGRHPVVIPALAFVVLATITVVGLLTYTSHDKVVASDAFIVLVSHDHLKQTIPTREPTVGALLKKIHVKIRPGDVVEPSQDTKINQDDFHINVYRGVPVEIVDGQHKTFTYSAATTPRSIVAQAGVQTYAEDELKVLPTTNFLKEDAIGERVVIKRSVPIKINLYGESLTLRTHSDTVGDMIAERGIKLKKGDVLKPSASTPIKKDMKIFVLRKGANLKNVTERVAMPVKTIHDSKLSYGTSAIRQSGSPGKKVVTYVLYKKRGKVVKKVAIQTTIIQRPVTQIVVMGTATPPVGTVKGDIVYWAKHYGVSPDYMLSIAQCESHFHTNSVNPNGLYKGLFQYGSTQWQGDTSSAGISGASIWDPNAQSHAAAWHISRYGGGAWSCG